MNKVIPLIFFLIVFGFFFYYETHHASSPPIATSSGCNQSLWNHVYHPQRLKIINDCTEVTGTIDSEKKEADGDFHIRLKLDSQYEKLLNAENKTVQGGDLVLEPVCENKITQKDAENACSNFKGNIILPPKGIHVRVVGSYVLDSEHGWNEIHPVTSITKNLFSDCL